MYNIFLLFVIHADSSICPRQCDGGTEYDMKDSDKQNVGTEITLYLNEDSYEFANEYKAREVIEKYCSFMPVPIFLTNEDEEPKTEEIPEEEVTEKDTVIETFIKNPTSRSVFLRIIFK